MKEIERLKERRAIAPVISALILSAVVLTVGGVVWAYSQGAMTISAEDYAYSVINMTDTISERFIVEHVAYVNPNLNVWIYNYGSVDIELKIDVKNDILIVTYPADPKEWIEISAEGFEPLELLSYSANSDDALVIMAYTKRGNNVYYRYIVP